jgi:hypothetical protein
MEFPFRTGMIKKQQKKTTAFYNAILQTEKGVIRRFSRLFI